MLVAFVAIAANAEEKNWKVTVTTKRKVEYRNAETNAFVFGNTEHGHNCPVFYVTAETKTEAREKAIAECSTTCKSYDFVLEQRNVKNRCSVQQICQNYPR